MQEYDEYNKYIYNWLPKFINKLMTEKYESLPFYILNKHFFDFPDRRGNTNKFILIGNNMIDPDKIFFVLDEETWKKIKRDYPNEIELKFKGIFNNGKCILEINNNIYYFYYIINNNIEEGYFKFNNKICKEEILSTFFNQDIRDFINKYKIREINETQKIYYENDYFLIKIKEKENKDNRINNSRKDNEIENDKFGEKNIKTQINTIDKNSHIYDNINDLYILKQNKNNFNEIPISKISKPNDNPIEIKDNNEYLKSIKIYKCAYYYFIFEQFLMDKCKNVLNFESLNLYLIDKTWIKYFKNHCNYNTIINNLNSQIENFQDDPKIFCDYFSRKYLLYSRTLQNKPYPPEKNKITDNEYYFDNYEFIDEKTLKIFLEEFNAFNADKLFKSYQIIIKNDFFIVIFDKNNLEVMNKNDRFLFSANNSIDLSIIEKAFKFSDYKSAFKDLDIKDINIPEQKVIYKMKFQIGKMRNISLIMNNNRLRRYNLEYKIKNKLMFNENHNEQQRQNKLYISYDNNNLKEQEIFLNKNNNEINGFISDNDIENIKIIQNNNKKENFRNYSSNNHNDEFAKKILNFILE